VNNAKNHWSHRACKRNEGKVTINCPKRKDTERVKHRGKARAVPEHKKGYWTRNQTKVVRGDGKLRRNWGGVACLKGKGGVGWD